METDERPWGFYVVLHDGASHKVKRIEIHPRKRLSLQRHRQRTEHWIIVEGEAVVTLDGRDIRMTAGGMVEIPVGTVHRIANPGDGRLVFIEVQRGSYFGEDDIERLEDDFGRA